MGRNLPDSVDITDSDAPWNDPGVDAYFPMTCGECGFTAADPEEMEDHEHSNDSFSQ